MNSLKYRMLNKELNKEIPLVYPAIPIGDKSLFTSILLIDSNVKDYKVFVDSVNSSTFPVVYSILSSPSDLLSLFANFTNLNRVGIVFTMSQNSNGNNTSFIGRKPFFPSDIVKPYEDNILYIINIINSFNIKNIDYLACNTLNYPSWVNYYKILSDETGVIVGASSDKTGNIKYGGDWIMESDGVNIEGIYFTNSIQYYKYLLDTTTTITNTNGWVGSYGPNTAGRFLGVTYGNGKYVAVGADDTTGNYSIYTSTDGTTWSTTSVGPTTAGGFLGVTYGNGKYIAVGAVGSDDTNYSIYTSTDGTTWSTTSVGPTTAGVFLGVTYGNGKYVAVGSTNNITFGNYSIYTSTDGTTWSTTSVGPNTPGAFLGVTYGNGKYVAVGSTNNITFGNYSIYTSTDGTTWSTTSVGPNTPGAFFGVTYGNGKYVTVGSTINDDTGNYSIYTSTDGTIWSTTGPNTAGYFSGVTYGNDKYVAVGTDDTNYSIYTSTDGTTWSTTGPTTAGVFLGVTYGNGKYIAVGSTNNNITGNYSIYTYTIPQTLPISQILPVLVNENYIATLNSIYQLQGNSVKFISGGFSNIKGIVETKSAIVSDSNNLYYINNGIKTIIQKGLTGLGSISVDHIGNLFYVIISNKVSNIYIKIKDTQTYKLLYNNFGKNIQIFYIDYKLVIVDMDTKIIYSYSIEPNSILYKIDTINTSNEKIMCAITHLNSLYLLIGTAIYTISYNKVIKYKQLNILYSGIAFYNNILYGIIYNGNNISASKL